MWVRKFRKLIVFFTLAICFAAAVLAAPQARPLSTDQAFQLTATAKDYQTVLLKWKIASEYYLYQKRFSFRAIKPVNAQLGDPLYPSETRVLKTTVGNVDVYAHSVIIPIPVIQSDEKMLILQVKYQGCSKLGYCYPPTTKTVAINLSGNYMQFVPPLHIDMVPSVKKAMSKTQRSFLFIIASFFGLGILLSLTPCVLPMIPILSGIIVGQKNNNHLHIFSLSLFYVLGMAMSYAAIGIVFAVLGKNVQLLFQQPWMMICFSILFVVMALSLFGLYQIQLPEKIRSFIAEKSYHQKSGTYIGVWMMGALSTLILSPCVTPPLVAALGIISEKGDMILGGFTLFAMGFGMGLPLLLVGLLGSRILPKPGKWMNAVKYFFGMILLVMAILMFQRAVPDVFTPFSQRETQSALRFQSVQTIEDIEAAIQKANAAHKPVMLDFYANWCLACKEFDRLTFTNPNVQSALSHYVLLRIDITKNSSENQMVEQYFGVVAPPTLLFFDKGKEIPDSRIIGYQEPKRFLKHLPQTSQ